jgi:GTP-binding protein
MADHASGPARHETGADLKEGTLLLGRVAFFHAAQRRDDLPPPVSAEVAFAGRSNVGKSSLLNALTGRRGLARVSSRPGRTQQLNFFKVGEGELVLVDMPGYGYAEAAKKIKEAWQGLMFDYLRGRPNLKRVLLLLDARVEVKPHDRAVMDLLEQAAVNFQLVLTKADALSPPARLVRWRETLALTRLYTAAHPEVHVTSAREGWGLDALREALAALRSAS